MTATTPDSPLRLELATTEDIPEIIDLWYNAFNTPSILAMWPDTPGVRQWWDKANRDAMLYQPQEKYLKVVDTNTGRIAAYARWSLQSAEDRGPRFPPWHSDMDPHRNTEFLDHLESNRARVVGGKKNFYLDMLATHTDSRRMGAARMLLDWGCRRADQEGVLVYVDASADGRPVYEKFGFVDRSDGQHAAANVLPLVREPRI
ncbi:acyl-CoA N-acyltransferase [Aspergillus coremiiformis]|uniref:Acyl-CoA N-acyltransferase n=1 Tax=Aspergillus coremiiformis TaxID=138285 RepID=A0A5N6YWK9_9EURO|nr:acyl-CoA N-acyltransferase [Aspergillus coremiiformis]